MKRLKLIVFLLIFSLFFIVAFSKLIQRKQLVMTPKSVLRQITIRENLTFFKHIQPKENDNSFSDNLIIMKTQRNSQLTFKSKRIMSEHFYLVKVIEKNGDGKYYAFNAKETTIHKRVPQSEVKELRSESAQGFEFSTIFDILK